LNNWNYSSEKLRIAVLGLRGIPDVQGGVEKHCQEIYSRLSENGYDITILARKGYIPKKPYEYKKIRVIPLWAPKKKNLEAIWHTTHGILWLARHRRDYDILHIQGIGPSLLAYFARKLGFCLVVTNHGPEYNRQKWGIIAKRILKLGERLGARHAYLVIAVSKHIKNLLFENYESVAAYIPNGVNLPERVPAGITLSNFGLESGRYFLTVGRLVPEKGFHDLLEAYGKLDTDWKLVIVGDADHEDKYSFNLKKKAGQINGVVMTGFQKGKALHELYSNAGLFVLPSYHEGLPIVALEAMSYKLPMLLSDIPANKELALPEETFPVGNVEVLSQRLKSFLENPSLLNSPQMIAQKKRRLETEFNWDVIAQRTADLYQAVSKMPAKIGRDVNKKLEL